METPRQANSRTRDGPHRQIEMRLDGGKEKLFWLLLAVAILFLSMMGLAGQSEAKCGLRCLNKRTIVLSLRLSHAEATIRRQRGELEEAQAKTTGALSGLLGCLAQIPVSRYGEEDGPFGYQFFGRPGEEPSLFSSTALDATHPDTPVGAWILVNSCEPVGPTLRSWLLPQR